jgi:hypothetical protein
MANDDSAINTQLSQRLLKVTAWALGVQTLVRGRSLQPNPGLSKAITRQRRAASSKTPLAM